MKERIKCDFDNCEVRIIINALNELRTNLKKENQSTNSIDDLLLKLIDIINRKNIFKSFEVR